MTIIFEPAIFSWNSEYRTGVWVSIVPTIISVWRLDLVNSIRDVEAVTGEQVVEAGERPHLRLLLSLPPPYLFRGLRASAVLSLALLGHGLTGADRRDLTTTSR